MTSAKLMMSGKVLYRDFFEQKGLFIYVLYILALHVIPDSFHGVYLFEVVASYFFYLYSYKSLRLVFDKNNKINFIATVTGCTCAYFSVSMWGGSEIEEFALPLLAYAIYQVIKFLKTGESISRRAYFIIGIHMALLFWSKYLIVSFYLACLIFMMRHYIKNKQYKDMRNMLIYCATSFLIISAGVVIYFAANNALYDMWDVYFYTNIFDYNNDLPIEGNYILSYILRIISILVNFDPAYYLFFFIYIWFICNMRGIRKKIFSKLDLDVCNFLVFTFIFMFALVFMKCNLWHYYLMPLCVYNPFGLAFMMSLVYKNVRSYYNLKENTVMLIFYNAGIIFLIACLFSYSVYGFNKRVRKSDLAQYKIANAMSLSEGVSFLMIDWLDDGYYFAADYIPDIYYPMLTNARMDEINQCYDNMIKKHEIDYVVYKENHNMLDSVDECLAENGYFVENSYNVYYQTIDQQGYTIYLYKLDESVENFTATNE
jgi:hypothetical protein